MSDPGEPQPPVHQPPGEAATPGTLAYRLPDLSENRRPGLVMALGVTSIVIAVLSGLMALFTLMQAFAFLMMARMSAAFPATAPTTTPAPGAATMPANAAVLSGLTSGTAVPRVMYVAAAIASFLVAILLLVAGIQTVRGQRSGRTLHLYWLPLKVIAATTVAVCYGLVMAQLLEGMTVYTPGSTAPPSPMNVWGTIAMLVGFNWVISLLYPLAVAIVIFLPSVRRYFASRPSAV